MNFGPEPTTGDAGLRRKAGAVASLLALTREVLGLARPGETVFIVREDQGPARP
jgi:hypothetical protein